MVPDTNNQDSKKSPIAKLRYELQVIVGCVASRISYICCKTPIFPLIDVLKVPIK